MLGRYRRVSVRGSVVFLVVLVAILAGAIEVHAQIPWERAALNLEATFTESGQVLSKFCVHKSEGCFDRQRGGGDARRFAP
jgi:hypothetical protein